MPGAGNAFYNHFVEFLRQTRYLLIHSLCFPVRCLSGAIPVIGGKSFAEIVAMLGIMAGIAYLAKGLTRNECGHLADYLSVVMISFSFRKVSLWSYFGIGFDRAIFWHKFVATITMAVMLKHTVTHILHGELSITGLIMCALLIIQCSVYFIFNFNNRNAVTKSCYNFNYFYFTHVSVYLILIPILAIHGAYFFAGIGVLWGLDLSIRYYFDCVSTTATVKLLTKDLIRVEIPNKFPRLRPGQYCFLNFPKISRFEYHPFAIGGTENDSVITFFVKIVGDWTGKLKDLHVGVAGLEPIEEEVCEPPKATDIEAGKSLSRSSSMEEKSPSPGIRRSPGLATDVEAFTSIDYDEVSTPPKAAASKVINVKRSDISPPTNDELEDIEDEEGYYNNSTLYHSSVMGGNPDTDLEMGGIIHAPLTSKPQGNNASKKIFSINNPGNKGSPTGSGNNSHTGSDKDMNKRLRSSPNTTTASNTTTTATVTAVTSKQSLTSSQPTDNSEKTTERSTTTTTAAAKKTASKCRTCGMRKDNDCDITQVDIRIEGPYGSLSYDLMDANTYPVLLLIGGGIGIVPKFGLLRNVITKYRYGRSPTLKKVSHSTAIV